MVRQAEWVRAEFDSGVANSQSAPRRFLTQSCRAGPEGQAKGAEMFDSLSKVASKVSSAAIFVSTLLFFVLSSVNKSLSRYHRVNQRGYSIDDLANPRYAKLARQAWMTPTKEIVHGGGLVPGTRVAYAFIVVDTVLIAFYLLAGVSIIVWLRRLLSESRSEGKPTGGLLVVALGALVVGACADLLENALLALSIGRTTCCASVTHTMSTLKFVLPLVALLSTGIVARYLHRNRTTFARGSRPVAISILLVIDTLVIGLVLFGGDIGLQIEDAFRVSFEHPVKLLLGLGGIALFLASIAFVGHSLVTAVANEPRPAIKTRIWSVSAVAYAALWLVLNTRGAGRGAAVLAVISALIASATYMREDNGSAPNSSPEAEAATLADIQKLPRQRESESIRSLLPWLSRVPLLALTISLCRIASAELIGHRYKDGFFELATAAVFAVVAVWAVPSLNRKFAKYTFGFKAWRVLVPVTVGLWIVMAIAVSSPTRAQGFGLVSLVFAFLAGATVVLGFLSFIAARHEPPGGLSMIGFRRVPVLVLGLISLFLGGLLSANSQLHLATVASKRPPHAPVSAKSALTIWIGPKTHAGTGPSVDLAQTLKPRPMIIVTASGGGIRAAAWTSLVMNCLFESPTDSTQSTMQECPHLPWSNWFAAGGASGGSVGLASVVAAHKEAATKQLPDSGKSVSETPTERASKKNAPELGVPRWIAKTFEADHVAALVGVQVFHEAPAVIARARLKSDRTRQLERSWQAAFPASTKPDFFSEGAKHAPFLSFNSTNVADGCRVNVSVLDLSLKESERFPDGMSNAPAIGPCSTTAKLDPLVVGQPRSSVGQVRNIAAPANAHDLNEVLCKDSDISLATAAFLSARFPFVSSAARVDSCAKNDKSSLSLVDGGYRENSGAAPMADLMDALAQIQKAPSRVEVCVRPVLVEIENGYAGVFQAKRSTSPAFESTVPFRAGIGSFRTETQEAPARLRQSVKAFSDALAANGCKNVSPIVVHFNLEDEPGARAPLGWSLSRSSLEHMNDQLQFSTNKATFDTLRATFPNASATPTKSR